MAPVPRPASSGPLIKNASAAPVVFFDNVPMMGTFLGNIEIELAVRFLMPKPDGSIVGETNCAAHLRCSPAAAAMLMDALEKALALHARAQQAMSAKAEGEDASPSLNN